MPIHDWTSTSAEIFHCQHIAWINELMKALNNGGLPRPYYALAEAHSGRAIPDLLTLKRTELNDESVREPAVEYGAEVLASYDIEPPVSMIQIANNPIEILKRRTITVRRSGDDRLVSMIELISPGNKRGSDAFEAVRRKVISALYAGINVLIIDLFPPGTFDPNGIHGAIWKELEFADFSLPKSKPLTLVAYDADLPITAYVEPTHTGAALIDMPVFLEASHYINVPLEKTYMSAFQGLPEVERQTLNRGIEK